MSEVDKTQQNQAKAESKNTKAGWDVSDDDEYYSEDEQETTTQQVKKTEKQTPAKDVDNQIQPTKDNGAQNQTVNPLNKNISIQSENSDYVKSRVTLVGGGNKDSEVNNPENRQQQEEQKYQDHGGYQQRNNYNRQGDRQQRGGYNQRERRNNQGGDYQGNNRRGNNQQQYGQGQNQGGGQHEYQQKSYQIDTNSNYRRYYANSHTFYQSVIEQEEAPYHFKVNIYVQETTDESGERVPMTQEHIDSVMQDSDLMINMLLESDYKALDIKSSRSGDNGNRLRVNFTVPDRETARKCFDELSLRKSLIQDQDHLKIFLVMDEAIFVKYGDIEAENYYAQQKQNKQQNYPRQNNRDNRGNREDRNQKYNKYENRNNEGQQDDSQQYRQNKRNNRDNYNNNQQKYQNNQGNVDTTEEDLALFKKMSEGRPQKFFNSKKKSDGPERSNPEDAQQQDHDNSHRKVTLEDSNQEATNQSQKPLEVIKAKGQSTKVLDSTEGADYDESSYGEIKIVKQDSQNPQGGYNNKKQNNRRNNNYNRKDYHQYKPKDNQQKDDQQDDQEEKKHDLREIIDGENKKGHYSEMNSQYSDSQSQTSYNTDKPQRGGRQHYNNNNRGGQRNYNNRNHEYRKKVQTQEGGEQDEQQVYQPRQHNQHRGGRGGGQYGDQGYPRGGRGGYSDKRPYYNNQNSRDGNQKQQPRERKPYNDQKDTSSQKDSNDPMTKNQKKEQNKMKQEKDLEKKKANNRFAGIDDFE